LTGLICERQVRQGQKTGAFSRISPDVLDRFSQPVHRMKALYVQMIDLYLIFQFFKGRCHGNQIIVQKCHQCRLIPLAFVPLMLENELQYHGLAVHINCGDDGATLSKNLVNFCPVTPEMTGLSCERQVRHCQKTGVYFVEYLRIHWTDFTIFSPYGIDLREDDGSLPYFPICEATLPWQPNNVAIMKAN